MRFFLKSIFNYGLKFMLLLSFNLQAMNHLGTENDEYSEITKNECFGDKIKPSDLTNFESGLLVGNFRMINELALSGSAQFTSEDLKKIINKIPTKVENITIVDLREEPHWLFKDSIASIQAAKADRYKGLPVAAVALLEDQFSKNHPEYQTEENCTIKLHANYMRILVTDATRPEDSDVDEFIHFAKNVKKNEWLHFHCLAGKGRTTTFMVMYEMLKTTPQMKPLKEILECHHKMGGADLSNMWYSSSHREWKAFVEHFYDYAKSGYNKKMSWSDWARENKLNVAPEQPENYSWWSIGRFVSNVKFAALFTTMKVSQAYRFIVKPRG